MSTLTVYSDIADGHIRSHSDIYATARAGGTYSISDSGTSVHAGQMLVGGVYYVYEGFISFDTSTIVGTVTSATLSLWCSSDLTTTDDFTLYARAYDWGSGLTTADWVAGADLSGNTLLASVSTVGLSTGAYTDLSSESAFASNVNTSGSTRIVLSSSRLEAGNPPPTGSEDTAWWAAEASAAYRPKLVVVYTAGISSHPYYYNMTYM